jgi:uncharacterized membrane protein
VLLPFTTQLLTGEAYGHSAVPIYIGVLLVSALSLVGLSWWSRRHRGLQHPDRPEVDDWVNEPASFATAAILLVALVLSVAVPAVGVWPLLLLLLTVVGEGDEHEHPGAASPRGLGIAAPTG